MHPTASTEMTPISRLYLTCDPLDQTFICLPREAWLGVFIKVKLSIMHSFWMRGFDLGQNLRNTVAPLYIQQCFGQNDVST